MFSFRGIDLELQFVLILCDDIVSVLKIYRRYICHIINYRKTRNVTFCACSTSCFEKSNERQDQLEEKGEQKSGLHAGCHGELLSGTQVGSQTFAADNMAPRASRRRDVSRARH